MNIQSARKSCWIYIQNIFGIWQHLTNSSAIILTQVNIMYRSVQTGFVFPKPYTTTHMIYSKHSSWSCKNQVKWNYFPPCLNSSNISISCPKCIKKFYNNPRWFSTLWHYLLFFSLFYSAPATCPWEYFLTVFWIYQVCLGLSTGFALAIPSSWNVFFQ